MSPVQPSACHPQQTGVVPDPLALREPQVRADAPSPVPTAKAWLPRMAWSGVATSSSVKWQGRGPEILPPVRTRDESERPAGPGLARPGEWWCPRSTQQAERQGTAAALTLGPLPAAHRSPLQAPPPRGSSLGVNLTLLLPKDMSWTHRPMRNEAGSLTRLLGPATLVWPQCPLSTVCLLPQPH